MVLKIFLILTLLFNTQLAFAKKRKKSSKRKSYSSKSKRSSKRRRSSRSSKSSIIKKGVKYHSKKQYKKSNAVLRKAFKFGRPRSMPVSVLYVVSLNYHKMGNHKSALYYFNQLIKKAYLKKHIRVIRALKKDTLDDVKIPKVLKATYYYMGLSYYALFNKGKRLANATKAKRYFSICDEVDFNDSCADYIENLTEKQEVAVNSINQMQFFISGATLLFQDQFNIKTDAQGANSSIVATYSGLCYGAGIRYGNSYSGYEAQGCAYSGTATVTGSVVDKDNAAAKNTYQQSGVPVAGLLMEAGYYIKPVGGDTRLGLSVPVLYRSALFSNPGEGYTVEGRKDTHFGLMLTAGWEVWFFEAQMKLANMGSANLLSLQGVINF